MNSPGPMSPVLRCSVRSPGNAQAHVEQLEVPPEHLAPPANVGIDDRLAVAEPVAQQEWEGEHRPTASSASASARRSYPQAGSRVKPGVGLPHPQTPGARIGTGRSTRDPPSPWVHAQSPPSQ